MDKRGYEGAWEYNLDVEILVLGSIHYYHYGVCIFKADGTSRLQQQVSPDLETIKAPGGAASPPCGERSVVQGGGELLLITLLGL